MQFIVKFMHNPSEVHAVYCEVHAVYCEVHAVYCEVHAVYCEIHAVMFRGFLGKMFR
jgi:hypothetical protein